MFITHKVGCTKEKIVAWKYFFNSSSIWILYCTENVNIAFWVHTGILTFKILYFQLLLFPSFSLRAAWKFLRVYVTAWIRAAASGSLGGALEGAVTHWDGQLPLVPGMAWPLVKDNRHFPLLTPWKASYHRVLPSRMWGTIWSYRFICFLLYHDRVFFMVCYGNQMRNMPR